MNKIADKQARFIVNFTDKKNIDSVCTIRRRYRSASRCVQWSPQCRQWSSRIHNSLWSTSTAWSASRPIQRPLRCRQPRSVAYYELLHVGEGATAHAEALSAIRTTAGCSHRLGSITLRQLGTPRTTRNKLFDVQNWRRDLSNTTIKQRRCCHR